MNRARLLPAVLSAATLLAAATARSFGAEPASYEAFIAEETALKSAVDTAGDEDARESARLSLARFYAARDLHVEAIAALEAPRRRALSDAARLQLGRSHYALGRYEAALGALDDERLAGLAAARGIRAMSLARLGAFARAADEFRNAEAADGGLAGEYHLLKARTLLAGGEIAAARTALAAIPGDAGTPAAEVDLAVAEIALAAGDDRARAALTALAAAEGGSVAARAALALFAADAGVGRIPRQDAPDRLHAIAMLSSGPEFERRWLAASAALAPADDPGSAIDAFRRLAERHPLSDAGVAAGRALSGLLSRLAERDDLPARTVARVFYENIEFAPSGAEGDALIRRLAARLEGLDLLSEAAELLEHQVFNRLRGAERTRIAADLADIYLKDRRPSEALRVIRSTRIAGLEPATNERRRLIEATALERVGAPAAARELLGDAAEGAALKLRAEIEWRARNWSGAAAAYRSLAAAAAPPLDDEAKSAITRAAAAYLLAGDAQGFEDFRRGAEARLGELPERRLIDALALATPEDRAGFLKSYSAVFAP
jgi:hypothetical protein